MPPMGHFSLIRYIKSRPLQREAGTSIRADGLLRMQIKQSLVIAALVVAGSSASFAQAPPTPATPPAQAAPPAAERTNANCAATQTTPEGRIAPTGTTTGQSPEPLGDKLAKSDGVLCPPKSMRPSAFGAPTAPKAMPVRLTR
jgi:hypothetical protein